MSLLSGVLFTQAASSGKRNLTVWRPSVRLTVPFVITLIKRADSPGAAFNAASVHFGPTIRRTDVLVEKRIVAECNILPREIAPLSTGNRIQANNE